MSKTQSIRLKALRLMLKPLVRFSLRGAHSFQDFLQVLKVVFVEVAVDEIQRSTTKINVSRISLMCGLNRADVRRIYRHGDTEIKQTQNFLSQVVARWEQSSQFQTPSAKPKSLSCEGEGSEFWLLVEHVSRHLNPGTVLFELERREMVEITKRGVRLKKVEALHDENVHDGFRIVARDIDTLLRAGEENIFKLKKGKNLHLSTEYTSIVESALPAVEEWLLREGAKFHKRARQMLVQYDSDLNPELESEEKATVRLAAASTTIRKGGS